VLVAWILLPALLAALALGVGMLVESATGRRIPGVLLLPVGLAGLIVAGQATASFDPTAELTVPLAILLAIAGWGLALRRRRTLRPRLAPTLAFVLTGLVFAAPVLASGDPTFGGYIRLDDTSTWLAITDRIMEHGRSLDGLAPSTYEAALSFNIGDGYPIGIFVPLGIGGTLTGSDIAWLIQPYMSVIAGALALTLFQLAGRVVTAGWARAVVAVLAAQPALLVGYVQWGGVKEVAAALLVALVAALAVRLAQARSRRPLAAGARAALPVAIASAALLAVISAGGALWLLPPLGLALIYAWRRAGAAEAARRALGVAVVTALLSVPAIVTGAVLPPTSSPLTSDTAKGNLFEPLELEQVAGIWPAGDFRGDPVEPGITGILIAIALIAAVAGVIVARRRSAATLVYVVGTLAAAAVIVALGSPWVDGKALATAAPAVALTALLGAVAALAAGSLAGRALGAIALVAVAGGILWSNALAYRDVSLAPYEQLAELERIGEMVEGEGPTLMTEYQPYGARHFLREADPEGVSELRRRAVPLRNGLSARKGVNADTDEISPPALHEYMTLVLRRSPVQSRPPAPYRLVWEGRYYEVWQRPAHAGKAAQRIGLGDDLDPTARLDCGDLAELVGEAPRGEVIAAGRPPTVVVPLDRAEHPPGWAERPRAIVPGEGTVRADVAIPRHRSWSAWLAGSVPSEVELLVDGEPVGSAHHFLNNYGFFVDLGAAELAAGRHRLELRFDGAGLAPGRGTSPQAVGPLILSASDPAEATLTELPAARAGRLCERRWDWIEVASGRRARPG